MSEHGNGRSNGILAEIVAATLTHAKELAASYLLFVREVAREEAKQVGRRTVLSAALLLMLVLGITLLGIGVSRLIGTLIEFEGSGYIITGGGLALLSILILLVSLRPR